MTPCAFCKKAPATVHTTESDYVCRECAIGFELQLQFGDEFERYEKEELTEARMAAIELERLSWWTHFEEQSKSNHQIDALMESGADHLSKLAAALKEIDHFAKLGQSNPSRDNMLVQLGLIRDAIKDALKDS